MLITLLEDIIIETALHTQASCFHVLKTHLLSNRLFQLTVARNHV